jgi:hypothetical protein
VHQVRDFEDHDEQDRDLDGPGGRAKDASTGGCDPRAPIAQRPAASPPDSLQHEHGLEEHQAVKILLPARRGNAVVQRPRRRQGHVLECDDEEGEGEEHADAEEAPVVLPAAPEVDGPVRAEDGDKAEEGLAGDEGRRGLALQDVDEDHGAGLWGEVGFFLRVGLIFVVFIVVWRDLGAMVDA